jgi:predicted DCC family thiol-disulfide oxidoreductase YuxK
MEKHRSEIPAATAEAGAVAAASRIEAAGPVIVFDAECVLCSANARFILERDGGRFRLAAMQGEVGASLFRRFGIDPADPDTLILVREGRVLRDSDAILAIYGALGWPWRGLRAFVLVPRAWRDRAYRFVARNRYRLFGQRESCWLPPPEHRARVL